MIRPLNVAIIGAGIGAEHLAGYRQLPDKFAVHTVCDKDINKACSMVSGDTSIAITTDLQTLLTEQTIDIIDICLPPHLHFNTCMAALAAGKHVICEKPLVSSLAEVDALAQQAATYQKIVMPVFQYRYGPALKILQALIDAGFAGKAYAASIETHWNRDSAYYDNPWRGTWAGEQGGAVLGHAIHNHDLLCAVMGPVSALTAFTSTSVNDIEVEDCAAISFDMSCGALATSSITLGAANDTTRLRFCFEHLTAQSGSLPYAPAESDWTFTARNEDSQPVMDEFIQQVSPGYSGYAGLFNALSCHLSNSADTQHGRSGIVTLDDGRRSLELVSAIYHSARHRRTVQLPLTPAHQLYNGWILPGK